MPKRQSIAQRSPAKRRRVDPPKVEEEEEAPRRITQQASSGTPPSQQSAKTLPTPGKRTQKTAVPAKAEDEDAAAGEEEEPRRVTRQASSGSAASQPTPPRTVKQAAAKKIVKPRSEHTGDASPPPTATPNPADLCVYGKALLPPGRKTGEDPASASQPPPSPGLAKKRVLIRSGDDQVRVFRSDNPSTVAGSQEFDWAEHERQETQRLLLRRMQGSVLDEGLTRRGSRSEQAFSIFQIPYKLDTRLLSVKDLQTELKARFLPHTGTKEKLRQRLEAAIEQEEKQEAKPEGKRARKK